MHNRYIKLTIGEKQHKAPLKKSLTYDTAKLLVYRITILHLQKVMY